MFSAIIQTDTGEFVGQYEFSDLPRVGEQVSVSWTHDPDGVRIFSIDEVWHFAKGVEVYGGHGEGPATILRASEIT